MTEQSENTYEPESTSSDGTNKSQNASGGGSFQGPDNQKKKSRTPIIVVLVLVIVACLAVAGFNLYNMAQTNAQIDSLKNEQKVTPETPSASSSAASQPLAANPINFKELQSQNEDAYAWLYVPGTQVSYPVMQHPTDNMFYMNHDVTKAESAAGAVFTEDYNTTDFKDAVTLIYGHNVGNDQMFGSLHYFEEPNFFNENAKFYIYTPGHIYTYDIVSAFTTDDQHVLYRYGYFQTYDQLREFEQEILNPHTLVKNVRATPLDDSSKLVVLSTCNTGELSETTRYLVCGVLTDDQPTE